MMEKPWKLYILRCADGTLYTGITTNIPQRLEQHNTGKGAKYTRGRGPVELLHMEQFDTRGEASRREWAVKQLSREEKLSLIRLAEKEDHNLEKE